MLLLFSIYNSVFGNMEMMMEMIHTGQFCDSEFTITYQSLITVWNQTQKLSV